MTTSGMTNLVDRLILQGHSASKIARIMATPWPVGRLGILTFPKTTNTEKIALEKQVEDGGKE
jgi:hypothetical protein